ncbi:MAG: DUF4350 domain-containing protein [Acidobacteria bacterium]|nr:DUF4350 domain-containing protein [Acidobacteriota bacterium]
MNRKALGNLLIVGLLIVVMVGLNLLFYRDSREETETEQRADRSTYSGRTYGLLGYFTLLEESKIPVGRWRQQFTELKNSPTTKVLVIVSPSPIHFPTKEEITALQEWVHQGGTAVIIDRSIKLDFTGFTLETGYLPPVATSQPNETPQPRRAYPWQPTSTLYGVDQIELSEFASSLQLSLSEATKPQVTPPWATQSEEPTPETAEEAEEWVEDPDLEEDSEAIPAQQLPAKVAQPVATDDAVYLPLAGVDHFSILAQLKYGQGNFLCLSDEFIFANNGISRADNAILGLNLASAVLDAVNKQYPNDKNQILFDEFHHGYHSGGPNYATLAGYFRGSPIPWLMWQFAFLGLFIVFTYGRRFARPVPLKRVNRASSLEYVSAMAQIQLVAKSYDLAIENIYNRFHRVLCRYGGVPTNVRIDRIATAVASRGQVDATELIRILQRCQEVLNGKAITEKEMLHLTQKIREIEHKIGS